MMIEDALKYVDRYEELAPKDFADKIGVRREREREREKDGCGSIYIFIYRSDVKSYESEW